MSSEDSQSTSLGIDQSNTNCWRYWLIQQKCSGEWNYSVEVLEVFVLTLYELTTGCTQSCLVEHFKLLTGLYFPCFADFFRRFCASLSHDKCCLRSHIVKRNILKYKILWLPCSTFISLLVYTIFLHWNTIYFTKFFCYSDVTWKQHFSHVFIVCADHVVMDTHKQGRCEYMLTQYSKCW